MNKKLVIIGATFLLSVVLAFIVYKNTLIGNNVDKNSLDKVKGEVTTEEKVKIKRSEPTQNELEAYYALYENPYVIHLRKALDGYLDGTNEGIEDLEVVIEAGEYDDGSPSGLDSFSKDYYKSKFIVMMIGEKAPGQKIISILFQDKPDKLFNSLVFQSNEEEYSLRRFWHNTDFTKSRMEALNEEYREYIEDTEHAI